MSVRKLAGPFPLTNPKGKLATYVRDLWYWPEVGLMAIAQTPEYGVHMATMDGGIAFITTWRPVFAWWPAKKKAVLMNLVEEPPNSSVFRAKERIYEPLGLTNQWATPDSVPRAGADILRFDYRYIHLPDRRIYVSNSKIYRQVDYVPTNVVEADIFPISTVSGRGLYPGRHDWEAWVSGHIWDEPWQSNDTGCFYDAATQKVSSPVYRIKDNCDDLVYATDWGVLVSLHNKGQFSQLNPEAFSLCIWSLEVEPTELTPVEVAEGIPKSGQVVTYRVQLLGDKNDPAEGELVNWYLSGVGLLLDAQTKTDEDGYAMARVQYGLRETGTTTLEARVVC